MYEYINYVFLRISKRLEHHERGRIAITLSCVISVLALTE
jgi:hypothetical protein